MIIKGKSRAGPRKLAAHLGNAEKNERIRILESRGTVAQDLAGALLEMDAFALGTRCEKPLYHAAISPEPPHRLSPEERTEAIDALEDKLGLTGHARIVVMHEKLGREHIHVVWSRIDLDRMVSVSDSHNYRKHEEVARDLERRFGHERVQGAHHEREGAERPDRTPSRAELRQEERTGITGKEVKAEVTAAFRASDGPEAFKAALEEKGYVLAQGDRRDFVVVDRAGGVHSLGRRIEGMKAAELREFMAPLDRASLPTVEEAREIAADRASGRVSGYDEKKWDDALTTSAIERAKALLDEEKVLAQQKPAANSEHKNPPSGTGREKRGRDRSGDGESILSVGFGILSEAIHETLYVIRETGKELNFIADELTRPNEGGANIDQNDKHGTAKSERDAPPRDIESAQTRHERIERLLGEEQVRDERNTDDWEPDRQHEASGGGRTRSR